MSDIHCAVCGEPYEAYGVAHGDMLPWEANLFRAGAGCPCCEGVAPEGSNAETILERHARDVLLSGAVDDPKPWAVGGGELPDERPKWRRPEDPIVWSCDGCKAVVKRDMEVSKVEVRRGDYRHAYADGLYWNGCSLDSEDGEAVLIETIEAGLTAPESREINGGHYCPSCAEECNECGELTFSENMHLPEGCYGKHDAICSDCMEKIPTCSECSMQLGDTEETDKDGKGPCCAEDDEEEDCEHGEEVTE